MKNKIIITVRRQRGRELIPKKQKNKKKTFVFLFLLINFVHSENVVGQQPDELGNGRCSMMERYR